MTGPDLRATKHSTTRVNTQQQQFSHKMIKADNGTKEIRVQRSGKYALAQMDIEDVPRICARRTFDLNRTSFLCLSVSVPGISNVINKFIIQSRFIACNKSCQCSYGNYQVPLLHRRENK